VDVRRSRSFLMSACQLHDPRTRAIHLQDVNRAVISSCIVSVNEDEPTLRESVRLSGECTEVELAANLLVEGPDGEVVRG